MVNTGLFYNYVYVRELDDIWSKYGKNELWDLRLGSIFYIEDNNSSVIMSMFVNWTTSGPSMVKMNCGILGSGRFLT